MPVSQTTPLKTPALKTKKATPKAGGRGVVPAKRPFKSAPVTSASKDVGPSISPEERQRLIERAAYFRAEKRGFTPGFELQDWVEAEAEVLRLIGGA